MNFPHQDHLMSYRKQVRMGSADNEFVNRFPTLDFTEGLSMRSIWTRVRGFEDTLGRKNRQRTTSQKSQGEEKPQNGGQQPTGPASVQAPAQQALPASLPAEAIQNTPEAPKPAEVQVPKPVEDLLQPVENKTKEAPIAQKEENVVEVKESPKPEAPQKESKPEPQQQQNQTQQGPGNNKKQHNKKGGDGQQSQKGGQQQQQQKQEQAPKKEEQKPEEVKQDQKEAPQPQPEGKNKNGGKGQQKQKSGQPQQPQQKQAQPSKKEDKKSDEVNQTQQLGAQPVAEVKQPQNETKKAEQPKKEVQEAEKAIKLEEAEKPGSGSGEGPVTQAPAAVAAVSGPVEIKSTETVSSSSSVPETIPTTVSEASKTELPIEQPKSEAPVSLPEVKQQEIPTETPKSVEVKDVKPVADASGDKVEPRKAIATVEEWEKREQQLLKKIEDLEKVRNQKSEEGLKLELKVRDEEIELLKARVRNLETELTAALSKPGGKNHEMIENIKQQHEELLSKARGMIFDKTKMVQNQELQIQALTTQIQSLKDVNQITKDLLEIRNSEVAAMEDRYKAMEEKFKAEKERYGLVLQRAQTSTDINFDLKKEYETQLAIFKELREKYEQRVQALVAENARLKDSLNATKESLATANANQKPPTA